MTSIKTFLEEAKLPNLEVDAIKIRQVASNYFRVDGLLYKKGYFTPYLRCVASPDSDRILRELPKSTRLVMKGAT